MEAADFGLAPLDLVIGIPAKLVSYLTGGLPVIATTNVAGAIPNQPGLFFSSLGRFHSLVGDLIRDGNVPKRSVIARAASERYSIRSNVARLVPILNELKRSRSAASGQAPKRAS